MSRAAASLLPRALACLLIAAGFSAPLAARHLIVGVNLGESLPGSVTLLRRNFGPGDIAPGKMVVFRIRATTARAFGYPPQALWGKIVAGMPGDRVSVDAGGNVTVGGRRVGRAKRRSSSGLPLTPVRDGLAVPEGFLFVAGTHEDSLDSRYRVFGLVEIARVVGVSFAAASGREGSEPHSNRSAHGLRR